jgi:hypothetical protein
MITCDCYTCRWAVHTAQGVICKSIFYGYPIEALLSSVPYPCDGWEYVRKLVNKSERTV